MQPGTDAQTQTSVGTHPQLSGLGGWHQRVSTAIFMRSRTVDVAVVLLSVGIGLADDAYDELGHWPLLVLLLLNSGSLLWRRSYPGAVLVFTTAIYGYQDLWLSGPGALDTSAFALYAWVVYGRNRRLVWAGTVATYIFIIGSEAIGSASSDGLRWLFELAVILLLVVGVADRALQRQRYFGEIDKKMKRLETEQKQAATVAAQEERARIAREMHDVVAHSVSVMLIQATAAKSVLESSPEQSKTALENVETSGREALTDLRQVLGLLKEYDSPDYIPNPTLDRIPELIDNVQAAGHTTTYDLEGNHVVPVGIQTTLYRIAQEALTNVMKHAGSNVAISVKVITTSSQVTIRVIDDGKGAAAKPSKSGHGIIGMTERVRAFGGELINRPRAGGGFEVKASIPYSLPTDTSVRLADTVS